ncbi:hypothetical protein SK128_025485 [Halocaridina rubra]|uniref:Uncharacterized protein n=1 Tax=Halocaridina rubra TaxID=373956 RepID=A0AAN8ZZN1_HALRR
MWNIIRGKELDVVPSITTSRKWSERKLVIREQREGEKPQAGSSANEAMWRVLSKRLTAKCWQQCHSGAVSHLLWHPSRLRALIPHANIIPSVTLSQFMIP